MHQPSATDERTWFAFLKQDKPAKHNHETKTWPGFAQASQKPAGVLNDLKTANKHTTAAAVCCCAHSWHSWHILLHLHLTHNHHCTNKKLTMQPFC